MAQGPADGQAWLDGGRRHGHRGERLRRGLEGKISEKLKHLRDLDAQAGKKTS